MTATSGAAIQPISPGDLKSQLLILIFSCRPNSDAAGQHSLLLFVNTVFFRNLSRLMKKVCECMKGRIPG